MPEERFALRDDDFEFEPATPEQIERIGRLASEALDGSVSTASRVRLFHADYFEAEVFHHDVARYSHSDQAIVAFDDEETPGRIFYGHPGPDNTTGFSLALTASSVPDSELGYDAGTMDIVIRPAGEGAEFYLSREPAAAPGIDALYQAIERKPVEATEQHVQTSLRLMRLVSLLDTIPSHEQLTLKTAMQIREEFDTLDKEDTEESPAQPETVAALRSRLSDLLRAERTEATFMRKFSNEAGICIVSLRLIMNEAGRYTRNYEIRAQAPTLPGEAEVFVNALKVDATGQVRYGTYFDTDVDKYIEEKEATDPNFSFTRDLGGELQRLIGKSNEERQQAEEARQQGFHQFSQADANRFIQTLENPGEDAST